MKISELSCLTIKKLCPNADRVILRENKQQSKSGKVGITIIPTSGTWYSLDGDYNSEGTITQLKFGKFDKPHPTTVNGTSLQTIEELCKFIDEVIKK